MNNVAEFKVAHLYPPYQGRGLAKIVAHDGTKYSCQESQLAQFKEGEDVGIYWAQESFTSKKTGEKVSFKKFVSKIQKPNGADSPKHFTKPRMDPTDSLEARKTAWGEAFIRSGKIPLNRDAIKLALDELDAGIRMHTKPQRRDDLNDEIPEGDWAVKSENPADGIEDTF